MTRIPRQTKQAKSKILVMSLKEALKTKANLRPAANKPNHEVKFGSPLEKQFPKNNINSGKPIASMAKGASKSSHVPTPKGMKQPTASSLISVEKQKAFSRSTNASQPTSLKAMSGLAPKKRPSSDKDITGVKYNITKLGFSKGIHTVPRGNDRQDGIVIANAKDNVKFGEHHKEGDTKKAKHTLDSTTSDINCNSRSISSYPFGSDLLNKTIEKRRLIEGNVGQFVDCNGENNDLMYKKRKESLPKEDPKAIDVDSNVGVQVDKMSCKQMKKLKQSKNETEDSHCDFNHVGVEDDITDILKKDHAKVSVSSCNEQQFYSCSKPIDKLTWSGIFKIDDKKYVSLDGHLSTKSCEKAWNLSKQLLKVVEVQKLSRLGVWPKAWEVSTPTDNDIGIYLFPHEMRQDEGFDQLVREVMENDLALRAIIGEAEMLIFPSILLPNHHQTFQRKNYLWGVFKRRQDRGAMVEEPLNAMGHCENEKQKNLVLDQPRHKLLGEEPNQEMIWMASVVPLERNMLPPNRSTQEVEASHLKGLTNKGFDLKALGKERGHAKVTHVATDAIAFPASHIHINPMMGHTPDRLMGFVVQKTPKLDRIIREIEQEGALVFAMQGEMVGGGSWAVSKATATQK